MTQFEKDLQSFDTAQERICNHIRNLIQKMREAGVPRIDFIDDLGLDRPGAVTASNGFNCQADWRDYIIDRRKADGEEETMLEIGMLQFCFPPETVTIPLKLLTMAPEELDALLARLGAANRARLEAENKANKKKATAAEKAAKDRRYKQYLKLSKEFGGNTNDTEKTANETARSQASKTKSAR